MLVENDQQVLEIIPGESVYCAQKDERGNHVNAVSEEWDRIQDTKPFIKCLTLLDDVLKSEFRKNQL